MDRRAFLGLAAAGSLAGLAGCSRSEGRDDDYDVGMSSADFRPERLEVTAGTTVVWKNTSSRAHTITAYEDAIPADAAFFASGGFETEAAAREGWHGGLEGAIQSGETFTHRFEIPGEYDYFCIPHEPGGMVGTVLVSE